MAGHRRRGATAGALVLGAALALGGCGTPPWEAPAAADPGSPTEKATTSDRASSAPARSGGGTNTLPPVVSEPVLEQDADGGAGPEAPVVEDELASGSAERQLVAGAAMLEVTYWSTLARDEWTVSGTKPLTLSVGADAPGATGLAALSVEVDRLTADGWESVPPEVVSQPFVTESGVDVLLPATAGASVLVGDVGAGAYALRYTFVYTVTSAGHTMPVQSVATDSLVVALAAG